MGGLQISGPPSRVYDRTFGQIGMWAIPNAGYNFTVGVTPAASTYRLMRFVPSRTLVVAKIGFVVTTAATANDSVDVGLYDAAGTRLVSSGATAAKVNGSTGKQTIDVTATTLQAGVAYYAGLAYGAVGGTAATLLSITPSHSGAALMWGNTAGTQEISAAVAGGTLPASGNLTTISSSAGLALAVLES